MISIFEGMHVCSRNLLVTLSLLCCVLLAAQDKPIQQSKNGWYLSPHGTIRILVLFVEIDYDVKPEKDPQPDGHPTWAKGKLPDWADNLFDPQELPQQKAKVSRYYEDISFGQYTVLGDYLNEVLTLKESEFPGVHQAHSIGRFAVQEVNERPAFKTHNGLDIADFDLWKRGGKQGFPKEQGADDPHSFDHVMVITRNSALRHGTGSTDGGSPGELFGYESDTQSRFGGMYGLPFEILKHEFNHLLIGGNNFHSGGGNAAPFESYFMNLQGGWSMMGAAGSSILTCSAWDRDRMGWLPDGALNRIRAYDRDGSEVDSDLEPLQGDTGIFVLRDFVRTGDAIRIRMPHIPEGLVQQWLWIENHQGRPLNGSPTDKFQWEDSGDCIAPIQPGLFMTMQMDREDREGTNIYGGRADYLRPVIATGFNDLRLRGDTIQHSCLYGNPTLPFLLEERAANPFTGNHEQELISIDKKGKGRLEHGDHWVPGTRVVPGKPDADQVFAGSPDHAFRMNGVRKLGMCTNPSSANMHTLISNNTKEIFKRDEPNVRTTYLNGISVELLAMSPNGEATVHVGINDTRMESDQRWCADSIVLPPLRGTDGHSLTISRGTTLLIDRSRTPTRMTEPDSSNGGPWFSDPTVLTLLEGASVLVEERGKLQLKNGATVHLLPGSELVLEKRAKLIVEPGSRIVLHSSAMINAKKCALKKLRKKGQLIDAL